jgi:spermidine/putrescine transport system permease protein
MLALLWLPLLAVLWKGASPEAFSRLFANREILLSFRNSLILAGSTAFLTTAFGLATAFGLPLFSPRVRVWIASSLILPLVLPEIAFGISYLVWYQFLHFGLGWTTLILSHFAFTFCYSVLVLRTSVEQIDSHLADAAKDLGAHALLVFRHAVLPQILPGLLASLLLTFSLSLDDFLITFFVKGIDQITLPIKIFSMLRLRFGSEIYALSVVLFGISFLGVVISQVWLRRSLSRR